MSAVTVELLRDPDAVIEAAQFYRGFRCARCEAEGYSRACPNCHGLARYG